jgi:hypothetical protein
MRVNEIYEYVQRLAHVRTRKHICLVPPFEMLLEPRDGNGLANYKFASFNTTHEADRQLILKLGPSAPANPNYSVAGSSNTNPLTGCVPNIEQEYRAYWRRPSRNCA